MKFGYKYIILIILTLSFSQSSPSEVEILSIEIDSLNGETVYLLRSSVNTNSFLSTFYKVQDEINILPHNRIYFQKSLINTTFPLDQQLSQVQITAFYSKYFFLLLR